MYDFLITFISSTDVEAVCFWLHMALVPVMGLYFFVWIIYSILADLAGVMQETPLFNSIIDVWDKVVPYFSIYYDPESEVGDIDHSLPFSHWSTAIVICIIWLVPDSVAQLVPGVIFDEPEE